MSLPKWLTSVTPFSKTITFILFIGLPILGFILGVKYQQLGRSDSLFQAKVKINPLAVNSKIDYKVTVLDFQTRKPIPQATVELAEEIFTLGLKCPPNCSEPNPQVAESKTNNAGIAFFKFNQGQFWITKVIADNYIKYDKGGLNGGFYYSEYERNNNVTLLPNSNQNAPTEFTIFLLPKSMITINTEAQIKMILSQLDVRKYFQVHNNIPYTTIQNHVDEGYWWISYIDPKATYMQYDLWVDAIDGSIHSNGSTQIGFPTDTPNPT